MRNRDILNVLSYDDAELGAHVRHAVALGHQLTLVLGPRPPIEVEMPCDVCMKPEPNRDDCATCGPEHDSLDLMERFAWESARSLDPVDALRWVNVAALCIRLRLALGGAPWPT